MWFPRAAQGANPCNLRARRALRPGVKRRHVEPIGQQHESDRQEERESAVRCAAGRRWVGHFERAERGRREASRQLIWSTDTPPWLSSAQHHRRLAGFSRDPQPPIRIHARAAAPADCSDSRADPSTGPLKKHLRRVCHRRRRDSKTPQQRTLRTATPDLSLPNRHNFFLKDASVHVARCGRPFANQEKQAEHGRPQAPPLDGAQLAAT